jgi:hypothetical protein
MSTERPTSWKLLSPYPLLRFLVRQTNRTKLTGNRVTNSRSSRKLGEPSIVLKALAFRPYTNTIISFASTRSPAGLTRKSPRPGPEHRQCRVFWRSKRGLSRKIPESSPYLIRGTLRCKKKELTDRREGVPQINLWFAPVALSIRHYTKSPTIAP